MANPTCPTDCADNYIPWAAAEFVDCNPETEPGWITKLNLGKPGVALLGDVDGDPTLANWNTRRGAEDDTQIVELYGIGNLPEPEEIGTVQIMGSNGYIRTRTKKRYTLTFDVQQMSKAMYEAMREQQCGGVHQMWYSAAGSKYLFGGLSGVYATIKVNPIWAGGEADLLTIRIVLTWDDYFAPECVEHPLAA